MVKGARKGGIAKVFSIVITCLVLGLLILSGPAQAFVLSLNIPDNNAIKGEVISFTGEVEIEANENLPINNLELELDGPENINCSFYPNGTIISGCKGISISLLSNASYEYGYGYGYYGYGYDFGYGYGYSEGTLKYNFTLNTTDYLFGNYSTELKANISSQEFSNPGENIYILESINITNLNTTPLCAFETNNITLSANVTGSILEVWVETNITNNITNHTTSSAGNVYSAIVNVPPGTFYWRFVVKDIAGNLYYSNWQSKYAISRTSLIVSPSSPDGLNGWYITEPQFTLTNPDNSGIYYEWDSVGALNYTGPFGLENIPNPPKESAGTLRLSYWSNTTCGFEEKQNKTFYIDLTNPVIKDLKPANGSTIYELRPVISAYLDEVYGSNSGIDKNKVEIYLDGAKVSKQLISEDTLDVTVKHTPVTDLSLSQHNVTVNATDKAGRNSGLTWFFTIEPTPFNLTVHLPLNGSLHNTKRVLFNMTTTKKVEEIEYINWNDRRPRWRILCRNCEEYGFFRKKTKTLNEGWNNITIRATLDSGYSKEENITLFIDSKKPKISKTLPRKNSVINGSEFYIKYTEDNLQEIILFWNPNKTLENCTAGKNQNCTTSANLSAYEKQWIEFWFEVSDKINTVESGKTDVFVDTISPALTIKNPINNTNFTSRKVPFNITITEDVTLEYIDNSDKNPRWRRLCSKCDEYGNNKEKTKSFKKGIHNIEIMVTDKAGNSDIREISFEVDY